MRKFRKQFRFLAWGLLLVCLAVIALGSFSNKAVAVDDSDGDDISNSKEDELASKYVPCLNFAAGEQFFPTKIEYHLNNSALRLKTETSYNSVDDSPTAAEISIYSSEYYYLDNKLGGVQEIADDYMQVKNTYGYIAYVRVTSDSEHFIVQYWFFLRLQRRTHKPT